MKRSELYKLIRNTAKEKMPWLQFVDLQKLQIENAEENYPLPLPCLLVEFATSDYTNLLQHAQIGTMNINIYLYVHAITDSFDEAELEEETIELLDYADEVFEVFEGLQVGSGSQLIRTLEEPLEFGYDYAKQLTRFSLNRKQQKTSPYQIAKKPQTIKITTE